ncbi:MAG: 3-methyl-2-oxobutanoate hydroxymethyltransferase [Deltaproteobacteria bacterium]|nr:3-methyl-2-oxobutanoate hydroxymethyltransferase [Deltaproteobacteria bacterium]
MRKKITISHLMEMKRTGEKIAMLTAYDYPIAKLIDEAGIETILVGDSVSNVVLGYPDTRPVTMDEMIYHTKIVTRAVKSAFVIGDMPFMSYQISVEEAIKNAARFIKEGMADAVKLEGTFFETIERMTNAGIPVVGHLGLTPQSASLQGGYVVQGKSYEKAKEIIKNAENIERAGAIMLVLEMVPKEVASIISHRLKIPVIGIGAGPDCDGQVLVIHDMLGLGGNFKFLKRYSNLDTIIKNSVEEYISDVKNKKFPTEEHTFSMPENELKKLIKNYRKK